MGLFSKKKESPEEKLVNELVGTGSGSTNNLSHALDSSSSQKELKDIVKEAWKNGASCGEIQKVYDENLHRLRSANEKTEDSSNKHGFLDNLPSNLAKAAISIVVIGIICYIVFLSVDLSLFGIYDETNYNEANIGGVTLNIPGEFILEKSGENEMSFYKVFVAYREYGGDNNNRDEYTPTSYVTEVVEIHVYKNKSLEDVLSSLSPSAGWYIHQNVSYGDYLGFQANLKGYPDLFVFENNGNTFGIHVSKTTNGVEYSSNRYDFNKSLLERILKNLF